MTSRLQTLHPELVGLLRDALHASGAPALLAEAQAHLAHPEHDRRTCGCDTCQLFRRVRNHLRRDS